jgi:eukaryotic-like serine/threonine-protein kinase
VLAKGPAFGAPRTLCYRDLVDLTPPDPRVGVLLQSRYQILERIAAGAMGVVYRGERVTLGRAVAVKFLHPWIAAQQTFRARFETEARAMSRLSHPNCVSVIDFGLEGSSPYVVMDFITGITLRQLLMRGPIPPTRAVGIARQILAGVAHAHSQQIIHRDLKPENMILSETVGLDDHVRILDFGLAKLRDGPAMTSGLALGTPSYMSPEQTGASGEVDGRTDLYAMGIVLFEMLAGRKPFVSEKIAEILVMHRDAPPPSLRQLVPESGISEALESVVLRALAKTPEARFQSATEFVHALDRVPEAMSGARGSMVSADGRETAPVPASVQIGPSLMNPVDETVAESAAPAGSVARSPTPSARPPRAAVGARMWLGLSALLCLALALVALGLRGAPPAKKKDAPPASAAAIPAPGRAAPLSRTSPNYPTAVAPSPPPPAAALSLSDRLRSADTLVASGEWEQAMAILEKAHRENPGDAGAAYRLANLALEHKRWGEGADAARTAMAGEAKYRSDERLVKNLIHSLASDKGYERSAPVLQGIGAAAVPFLRNAAAHDPSPVVRQRAQELLHAGAAVSRQRGPVVSRAKPAARPAEHSFFSR